jgi:hypothetical protein
MKDYKEYYNTIMQSTATTGDKPRIRDYILIKVTDNVLIVLLFILTISFVAAGMYCTLKNSLQLSTWLLDAGKLCLGVFLGLFAAKNKK